MLSLPCLPQMWFRRATTTVLPFEVCHGHMAWKDTSDFSDLNSFGVLPEATRAKIKEHGTLQMVASHSEDKTV